jgi:hypothetical protein
MPTNGQFTDLSTLPASDINTLLSRGYSNRIINGAFTINQRNYASGTNLASGAYGLDRWRSGFTNTALTFTAGVQSTTVTISTSGVLQQIVERENMPAGTYTLSWTGTATGRVYNAGATPPVYAASPIIVSLDGSANVVVEFTAAGGTRTLGTVQLEAGNVFSPFEYRQRGAELTLCQRYYEKSYDLGTSLGTNTELGVVTNWGSSQGDGFTGTTIYFKVSKRSTGYASTFYRPSGTLGSWEFLVGTSLTPIFPAMTAFRQGINSLGLYGQSGSAGVVVRSSGHWVVDNEI